MTEIHSKPETAVRLALYFVAIIVLLALLFYGLVAANRAPLPTADQLYGCTVAQQAPNGECK